MSNVLLDAATDFGDTDLKGDNMTTEQEKLIDALYQKATSFIDAQNVFDRCLAIEGTPALKDIASGYKRRLEEMIEASSRVMQSAVQS